MINSQLMNMLREHQAIQSCGDGGFMDNEILLDVKISLGPMIGDTDAFDGQILGFIDALLLTLDQLGAIKENCTAITEESTWSDIVKCPPSNYNIEATVSAVKRYVCLKTRLTFDPPGSSAKEVFESLCNELLWRIEVAYREC